MCRGAKIFFQLVGVSKKFFGLKRKCSFCFCLLYVGESEKREEKTWKQWKRKISKTENSVFWMVMNRKDFSLRWHFLENRQTLFVFGRCKRRAFSLTLSVLGKVTFLWPYKLTKHYKNRDFSRHRGNPKWHFWLQKCHFGRGPRKGALLSVIHKSCALLKKHHFYSVFSKTQLCRNKRVQVEEKQKFTKMGAVCQHAKICVFLFLVFFLCLVDVSDIFYFFCSGEGGRGSPRHWEGGGGDFWWKIPGGGGGLPSGPPFLAKRHFPGEGVGVYILRPARQEFYTPPPFYTPPTFRRVFSGVGGWGCIKIGPVKKFQKFVFFCFWCFFSVF